MKLPVRTINTNTRIAFRRMLPVPGETLVQRGQKVQALEVVARAEMPSRYRVIDVTRQFGQSQVDMGQVMLKAEGDPVESNEVIARASGGLARLRRSVHAPAAGRIAAIGSGWVLLETGSTVTEVQAFINGTVTWVAPYQGVVVETIGAVVEAVCGFGGEAYGLLKRLTDSPFEPLDPDAIDENARDTIILGGQTVDESTLRLAEEFHVRGIIVGSIDAALLKLEPPVKVRVVATEGFGNIPMSPHTFGVLRGLTGKDVSISACTPNVWVRPGSDTPDEGPIIVAATGKGDLSGAASASEKKEDAELRAGSRVRVIRGELLGNIGLVNTVPSKPQATKIVIAVPGAYVKFDDFVTYIPLANLEQII